MQLHWPVHSVRYEVQRDVSCIYESMEEMVFCICEFWIFSLPRPNRANVTRVEVHMPETVFDPNPELPLTVCITVHNCNRKVNSSGAKLAWWCIKQNDMSRIYCTLAVASRPISDSVHIAQAIRQRSGASGSRASLKVAQVNADEPELVLFVTWSSASPRALSANLKARELCIDKS